jgi:formylglycine-generating enzyme required for sulfatase activity
MRHKLLLVASLSLLLAGCRQSALSPTLAPTAVPATGSMPSTPSAGDAWVRPIDGMVMVYVPAGEFLMGAADADGDADIDEKPQHSVYLNGFWIDKTEVTNAQYGKCVEAGACEEPWGWNRDRFIYSDRFNAPDQPVVCVLWNNAHDYAVWVGGRLPTEAEWEKVARGTDGRMYPWGNSAPDCARSNIKDCVGATTAVGS